MNKNTLNSYKMNKNKTASYAKIIKKITSICAI
jgi:hypothetical protein